MGVEIGLLIVGSIRMLSSPIRLVDLRSERCSALFAIIDGLCLKEASRLVICLLNVYTGVY